MTGRFEMLGDTGAPTCVDGVCALPSDTDEAAPADAGTASDGGRG